MVLPFPLPGPAVTVAYRILRVAAGDTMRGVVAGELALLPRPWDPATCTEPGLRFEVWQWLDEVVDWLNHDHTWDTSDLIPTCWIDHPHLVHEIAVLADLRYRAAQAATSEQLEEWHRICLPAFTGRLRERGRAICEAGHVDWPGRARYREHRNLSAKRAREERFVDDVAGVDD